CSLIAPAQKKRLAGNPALASLAAYRKQRQPNAPTQVAVYLQPHQTTGQRNDFSNHASKFDRSSTREFTQMQSCYEDSMKPLLQGSTHLEFGNRAISEEQERARLADEARFADQAYAQYAHDLQLNQIVFKKYAEPTADWDWR